MNDVMNQLKGACEWERGERVKGKRIEFNTVQRLELIYNLLSVDLEMNLFVHCLRVMHRHVAIKQEYTQ